MGDGARRDVPAAALGPRAIPRACARPSGSWPAGPGRWRTRRWSWSTRRRASGCATGRPCPAHNDLSPWAFLTMTSALPFVVRAAWLAGRLGKPMLPSYKTRFAKAIELDRPARGRLGARVHGAAARSLRVEAMRDAAGRRRRTPSASRGSRRGTRSSKRSRASSRRRRRSCATRGLDLGRDFVVVRTENLPASSRYRYTEREDVPEELALPGLFDAWYDANNGERGADMMLRGVVAAARARAEDFYFPAPVLHAIGPRTWSRMGASLVEMRRTLVGVPQTAAPRRPARPQRSVPLRERQEVQEVPRAVSARRSSARCGDGLGDAHAVLRRPELGRASRCARRPSPARRPGPRPRPRSSPSSCLPASRARPSRRAGPRPPRGGAPRPALTTQASSFCANSSIISSSFGADLLRRLAHHLGRELLRALLELLVDLAAREHREDRRPRDREDAADHQVDRHERDAAEHQRDHADVVVDGVDLHVEAPRVAPEHRGRRAWRCRARLRGRARSSSRRAARA